MSSSLARRDAAALNLAAHSLKSSSSYMGAEVVVALSAELERAGRAGSIGDNAAHIALQRLESALLHTQERLRAAIGA